MDKLKRKLINKRGDARRKGLMCDLTAINVQGLLDDAGITVDDWSIRGYHLARYNDSGNYELGNCRFITYAENIAERKTSEAMRVAASRNIRKAIAAMTSEQRRYISKLGAAVTKLTEQDLRERFNKVKHLEPNKWGFGSRAARALKCSSKHVHTLKK